LVREDIFAGVLNGDMKRFSQGEKNIEILLESRPRDRGVLLGWKGAATLYRAVRELEAGHPASFEQKYAQAGEILSEAKKLGSRRPDLDAIIGGVYAALADRLPEKHRGQAWAQAYHSYRALWKTQGPVVAMLPTHLKGELLGGLAQSAQRTGHDKEAAEYLEKMVALLPGTSYAKAAKSWQDNPNNAAETSLTCLTCHAPGRLAARRRALAEK
jgi:hypothetical protein